MVSLNCLPYDPNGLAEESYRSRRETVGFYLLNHAPEQISRGPRDLMAGGR